MKTVIGSSGSSARTLNVIWLCDNAVTPNAYPLFTETSNGENVDTTLLPLKSLSVISNNILI